MTDHTYFVFSQRRTGSFLFSNLLDLYYVSARSINRRAQYLPEIGRGIENSLPYQITPEIYEQNTWDHPHRYSSAEPYTINTYRYNYQTKLIELSGNLARSATEIYDTTYKSVSECFNDGTLSSYKIMMPYVNSDLVNALKQDFNIKFVTIERDPYECFLSELLAYSTCSYGPSDVQNTRQQISIPEDFIIRTIKRIEYSDVYKEQHTDMCVKYTDLINNINLVFD